MSGAPLTDAQMRQFAERGYLAPLRVLTAARVADLRQRVDALIADLPRLAPRLYEVERAYLERPDAVVCHFLGGWRVDPALRELVFDRALTEPAAQLLGVPRLRLWHDQVFAKPPHHKGVVPWHQDYSYWTRTAPPCHITVHVALDDSDEENGALQVMPGSHRLGLLPKVPFDAAKDALLAALTPQQRAGLRPVMVRLRAGEASLHHSHLVHGSDANRSPRPRRALVCNYMGAEVRCADDRVPLLAGADRVPVGAVVDGPLFPIVLDRGAVT